MESTPKKPAAPRTPAQLEKQKREKNAALEVTRLTGVGVPPTIGAKYLRLQREGQNTKAFLNEVKAKAATRSAPKPKSAPKSKSATKKNTAAAAAPAANANLMNLFVAPAAPAPLPAANALNLTNDDLEVLKKCERIHEKILQKAKQNIKNYSGKNANVANAQALANVRKTGATVSAKNFMKVLEARKQQNKTRKGRPPMTLNEIAMKLKTPAVRKALEEFLEKNA
jgi:hypothetical protein